MSLRAAVPADAAGIATVHVRSWQRAYRGLLPQDVLDGLSIGRRTEQWAGILEGEAATGGMRTVVADDDGAIAGFASCGPTRDADHDPAVTGELVAIYVLPERFGHGFGRALIQAVTETLTVAGFREACLWVLAGNNRAIGFYEAAGWTADGTSKDDEIAGNPVTELRYGRTLP